MRVRADRHSRSPMGGDDAGVIASVQNRVVPSGQEGPGDQVLHQFAAAAMPQYDLLGMLQGNRADQAFDRRALQHLSHGLSHRLISWWEKAGVAFAFSKGERFSLTTLLNRASFS